MTGQASLSGLRTEGRESRWYRRDSERRKSQTIGAVVVAGGLAFSAALYPQPDGLHLHDLLTPGPESPAEPPNSGAPRFLSLNYVDAARLNLGDLVKLAALTSDLPALATSGLVDLVQTYGLPDVVRALELIRSFSPLAQGTSAAPVSRGGDDDRSVSIPASAWPAMIVLLDYIQQHPPQLLRQDLLELITAIFPAVVQSLSISQIPAAPAAEAHVASAAAPVDIPAAAPTPPTSPPSVATDAPVSTPTGVAVVPSADLDVAPIPQEAVVAPSSAVTVSPTSELPVATPSETSSPMHTETDSAPLAPSADLAEEPNAAASESNSTSPEPPPAAGGEAGGGSTAGAPSGGSGGDSPGESGGGSTGDPGGGSAGSD